MNGRPRRNHDELVRHSADAIDREDFGEAEALSRRALMLRPESVEARQCLSSALIEQGIYEEAAVFLRDILEVQPDDLPSLADLGLCLFEACDFEGAEAVLARALEVDSSDPQACYWMALCIERRGQYPLADKYFLAAHEMDPEAYPVPTRISRTRFTESVEEALDQLPDEIRVHLKNLSIMVEDLPRDADLLDFNPPLDPCLYGLYVGVPLPERTSNEPPELPDTIFLYQRNLERFCRSRAELVREIKVTLLHEIGHFLGYDEEDLAERGLA